MARSSFICQQCGKRQAGQVLIDGQWRDLNSRKRCLECSPFGAHNNRHIGNDPDKINICGHCGKEYKSKSRHGLRKGKCGTCSVSDHRRNAKKKLVEYLGGRCILCSYDFCVDALVFHHRDSSTKEFTISGKTSSFEKLKREADKCVLLCNRCHSEVHAGLKTIPL